MLLASPTDVPPNFITITRAIVQTQLRRREGIGCRTGPAPAPVLPAQLDARIVDPMTRIADLIYDWNQQVGTFRPARPLQFDDETLRDGLQSPAVSDPDLQQKFELLEAMDRLGIHTAN